MWHAQWRYSDVLLLSDKIWKILLLLALLSQSKAEELCQMRRLIGRGLDEAEEKADITWPLSANQSLSSSWLHLEEAEIRHEVLIGKQFQEEAEMRPKLLSYQYPSASSITVVFTNLRYPRCAINPWFLVWLSYHDQDFDWPCPHTFLCCWLGPVFFFVYEKNYPYCRCNCFPFPSAAYCLCSQICQIQPSLAVLSIGAEKGDVTVKYKGPMSLVVFM